MLGAIIGDVAGSTKEFNNHKTTDPYDFELFPDGSQTTDDSILTCAVAAALLDKASYEEYLLEYAEFYRPAGKRYGGSFANWVDNPNRKPYNSWGNGAAMRVSAVGWWFKPNEGASELDKVLVEARKTCEPTHNHPESYKAAEAVAGSIHLALCGMSKEQIKGWLVKHTGYNLARTTDEIRPDYRFHVSCMKSVPEALICFLESKDYEHAIRLGISLSGDSDTIAAIAGSVAEAFHGIPDEVATRAAKFIEPELIDLANQFHLAVEKKRE